jgi:hypothetical protein
MDDFNYHSTYSSGWRRISKEKSETEDRQREDILKGLSMELHKKPVVAYELKSNKTGQTSAAKAPEQENKESNIHEIIHEATKPIKQTQTDIMTRLGELQKEMTRLGELQKEMTLLKQLLDTMNEKTAWIQQQEQKKATGSKLSRFFK